MPNQNGTGPEGKGPRTGRQFGKCTGTKPCPGKSRGIGLGIGRRSGQGLGRNFRG
jgi:hypothetical protein